MQHIFIKGTDDSKPTLLLLHGTGGNEHDLVALAKEIDPTASLLGVRGNVVENGMPRFFRRLAEGVFDLADLELRTKELVDFIDEAATQYRFDRKNVVAIGYSNGANIAGSLLFHNGPIVKGAILHHPMVPRREIEVPALPQLPVWIGAGKNDHMCPPKESKDLEVLLTVAGAEVEVYWSDYGHQLTHDELNAAKAWYSNHF
ncbi:alpha/beta hydrolase [Viridibacillus sp. YIM B01967]|uniref:Alpha/beta hydrolase n=1 Tax=Viridibacillus soli TaxID=2798301 RepID=A0ABS1H5D3_9BACL|nr:alpha/beta hydrolase [Viridibacillus soli]MBK3494614.1 alpha/beta hydrolase [Viridibacillus soli]